MKGWLAVVILFVVAILVTIILAANHVHYCVSYPGTNTKACQGYYKK